MMYERFEKITAKEQAATAKLDHTVQVCVAASCLSAQSDKVLESVQAELKEGNQKGCQAKGVGCMGLCSRGPLVNVLHKDESLGETLYQDVTADDAPALVAATCAGERLNERVCQTDVPFFQRQTKIVLENSGRIDPERIEEYVAVGGYEALLTAVTEMTPSDVIDEVLRSGLRGRGGGGYPTGLKWTTVAKADANQRKYVICNADEGDPGAFMDRSVLESDPHRILEGMALAGYAIGARKGYIYVRGEYPLAVARLKKAINQARRLGVLGDGICGTTFNFQIEIRLGAGAFVCGEETALIASVEGKRGQPRPRPPYPAELGLWGEPTLINNVETFANVAPIVRNGGNWYAGIGTDKSKGTKVFALAGSIVNTGLIEVPMGIPLKEIVFEIGGGIPGGHQVKAVQTGGPSGGCIPAKYFDTPVDYESLVKLGSIMGSGGMIVMDETSNMVDVARFFMEFCKTESCGKCVPCRVGTVQMYDLLDKIYRGEATSHDLELLEKLCTMVREMSLCGLGQTAPNPVNSTLHYFRNEYTDLLRDKNEMETAEVQS
ncbi:NADH-quinone oxidoreductase subunit NuoF [Candidatus Leptofilum sp.]|uniref:NADH-quinone oxidoreductase subunit NuoF n=1 Tax=Candidatus Leptofilum sp. TaxID=3241576 RepID=UPI003B5B84D7